MPYLITLHLPPPRGSLQQVKQLAGLKGVEIDEDYGLVLISPRRHLYTIRVTGPVDADQLMAEQPEVKGVYPDVRIGPMGPEEAGGK